MRSDGRVGCAGAYVDLALAMVIVGSSVVAGKLVIASFPVFLAAGLRFGVAAPVLFALLLLREGRIPRISRSDWLILFAQTFFGAFLFTIFLLYGLRWTAAADAGIITSTTPAVTGVLAVVLLRERLTARRVAGLLLATLGVMSVSVGTGGVSVGSHRLLGNALVFGAAAGEALFTVLGKMISKKLSPLAISTAVSSFGFLLFLPLSLWDARGFRFTAVSAGGWGAILYYALAVTVLAYLLWYRGLSRAAGSTAGVFTGVVPVSAILLSHWVLGENLRLAHLAGVTLVLAAIVCTAGVPRRDEC